MRNEASSDVFKVWLYAAASVMLGAWAAPLLYNAGKAIAEVCATKQTNGPLDWLAGICERTGFPGFFEASLMVFAAILFLPFIQSLRGGRASGDGNPWSFRLPKSARARTAGQRLAKNSHGLRQGVVGFLLVTALFLILAGVMVLTGIFEWKNPDETLAMLVFRAAAVALGLAVLQEILFRGIAMGIFLRAMRPAAALGMSALLFALVHALNPPPGVSVFDADASGIGFELLRNIAARFSQPRVLLGTLVPLLALGGVLAYARWRTASLCMPIGLHAGWIFTNLILGGVTVAASRPGSIMWVISGASLTQGLVAIAGILIAGALANYLTAPADDTDTPA
jgi:membrane protease YdiL (CAAX protease family)